MLMLIWSRSIGLVDQSRYSVRTPNGIIDIIDNQTYLTGILVFIISSWSGTHHVGSDGRCWIPMLVACFSSHNIDFGGLQNIGHCIRSVDVPPAGHQAFGTFTRVCDSLGQRQILYCLGLFHRLVELHQRKCNATFTINTVTATGTHSLYMLDVISVAM